MTEPVPWTLADGREELFFALPGNHPAPVPDRRPLPARPNQRSQLRFDSQTGQWVIIAALRQDRTYKPPADQCPLCPGPSGLTSEIPAPDYDVVVFENRFPSLSGAMSPPARDVGHFALPDPYDDGFTAAPGNGRCEVICFASDHDTSYRPIVIRAGTSGGHGVATSHRGHDEPIRHRAGVLLREPGRGDRCDADAPARTDIRLPVCDPSLGDHAA